MQMAWKGEVNFVEFRYANQQIAWPVLEVMARVATPVHSRISNRNAILWLYFVQGIPIINALHSPENIFASASSSLRSICLIAPWTFAIWRALPLLGISFPCRAHLPVRFLVLPRDTYSIPSLFVCEKHVKRRLLSRWQWWFYRWYDWHLRCSCRFLDRLSFHSLLLEFLFFFFGRRIHWSVVIIWVGLCWSCLPLIKSFNCDIPIQSDLIDWTRQYSRQFQTQDSQRHPWTDYLREP